VIKLADEDASREVMHVFDTGENVSVQQLTGCLMVIAGQEE